MDYSNIINNSRVVNVRKVPITNNFGRYWNSIRYIVPAVTDLKARVGKFNTPWNTSLDPLFAMPELKVIPDKLSDLMDQRAIEINQIAKRENKVIYIMWSGGIDSTSVLVAFLKNLPAQDLANIVIVMSIDSVLENPRFYETYIQNKFKCISYLEYSINASTLDNCIMLNGDPADALFGPSIFMFKHLVSTGEYLKPFKSNMKLITESIERQGEAMIKKFNVPGFSTWYYFKIAKNIESLPSIGIESVSDWWWWHYMNFKWEFSIWRAILRRKNREHENVPLSKEQIESFVKNTFFNTNKFQQWSYSNLRTHIINNDPATHKWEIKQYIYNFDHDSAYQTQKVKITSVPIYDHNLYFEVRKPFLLGGDCVGYHDNEHPELVNMCRQKLEEFRG